MDFRDVSFKRRKYHIKPHLSPWFSAACAATIAHRNYFFPLYQQDKPSASEFQFSQANNCCKKVLEAAKLAYTNNKLFFCDIWQIVNSVFNKGKSAISHLFNDSEALCSASYKTNLFTEIFSKNSNFTESGISLPVFPPKTNLKLHNIPETPSVVKEGHSVP